jgi:membrane protein YdbS with pleckstrin-like domain
MEVPPASQAVGHIILRLHEGEEVILEMLPSRWWTLGRYIFTLGLWGIWRKRHRFVLTNQRIVRTKGIVSKTERSAPLTRIQDAQLHRSPLTGGRVTLSTAGGDLGVESIGPLTQADTATFADALTPLLGRYAAGV